MRCASAFTLFLALPLIAIAQEKGIETRIGSLKSIAPADWKKEKPANLLRSYQFKLPGEKEGMDAEVAVFPESHPNPTKSHPRWKATFIPPDEKTIDDISKTTTWDVKGLTVTVLDISGGTWKYKDRPQDPTSKEKLLDNYRVVWVIVAEETEATHIRLSGPAATVDKHYKAFEAWVKALK